MAATATFEGRFAVGEDRKEAMPQTGDTSVELLPRAGKENCY